MNNPDHGIMVSHKWSLNICI